MRIRSMLAVFVLLAVLSGSSFASMGGGGGGSSEPPPSSSPSMNQEPEAPANPRKQAEEIYGMAYEEIAKAKKDLADGKAKNAEKKFHRALDRAERATGLDPQYFEAWNLVGYASRKLGDYDKAFSAYDKCLAVKADYAPAIEYRGEAWLEKDNLSKAREQLALLEKFGANDDAKTLKDQIDAYAAKHPDAAPAAAPAATDSSATQTSGSGR